MENLSGNKAPAPKISKMVKSANIRAERKLYIPNVGERRKENICYECGFHIRSKNHIKGAHHNGRVAPCHR